MSLVSVAVTVHHESIELVKKCLDSLDQQTYSNCDFIIVDDASITKGMHEFLQYYKNTHTRFRYIQLPNNVGYVKAKNIGAMAAFGTYFMFMDADHMLNPNFIKVAVDTFNEHEDCGVVVGSKKSHMTKEYYDNVYGDLGDILPFKDGWVEDGYWYCDMGDGIVLDYYIIGPVMFKRDVFNSIGYFKEIPLADCEFEIHMYSRFYSMGMKSYHPIYQTTSEWMFENNISTQVDCIEDKTQNQGSNIPKGTRKDKLGDIVEGYKAFYKNKYFKNE